MSIQDDYIINGSAFYLSKVFSSDFQYVIPDYQRPYSWEKEQIEQLFDDLYESFQRKTEEAYFLGSIVIIKENNIPKSEIVDGQQRITSLTILFSVLASFLSGTRKSNIEGYIQQPENEMESIPAQPRLTLRKMDNDFFRTYIQEIRINELKEISESDCNTDAQRNIYNNALSILNRIEKNFNDDNEKLFEFCKFIINRCCIVIVSTPGKKSAFRIFSVMNNRGLDLLPCDILKADLIGKLDREQGVYTEKWEYLENNLGREKFNELFSHIRMIYLKTKAQKSVLEEIQEHITPQISSVGSFIDQELTSYANSFKDLILPNNGSKLWKSRQYLSWLNRVNFSEWVPVAIKFLYGNPSEQSSCNFFKLLDRLTSYLYLSAKNVNERISRYSSILKEIENNNNGEVVIPQSLSLKEEEKIEFKKLLEGNVYQMLSSRRNYLILRVDEMISDGVATYNLQDGALTIEHVLPQTIKEGSKWKTWWDIENHELWLHRLANLVPLNKRRNSSASNFEFKDKKDKYFNGKDNVSSYALTTQVLNKEEWTPDIVRERQEELLSKIYEVWELA